MINDLRSNGHSTFQPAISVITIITKYGPPGLIPGIVICGLTQ